MRSVYSQMRMYYYLLNFSIWIVGWRIGKYLQVKITTFLALRLFIFVLWQLFLSFYAKNNFISDIAAFMIWKNWYFLMQVAHWNAHSHWEIIYFLEQCMAWPETHFHISHKWHFPNILYNKINSSPQELQYLLCASLLLPFFKNKSGL